MAWFPWQRPQREHDGVRVGLLQELVAAGKHVRRFAARRTPLYISPPRSFSDHFVGTVTSCFSRFVYQLRIAAMHHDPLADWTLDRDPRAAVEGWTDDWIMDP
jgi:hypothetical protein